MAWFASAEPLTRGYDVAVIGGGLCGCAVVLHLLRDHRPRASIALIEPSARLGAGLAYSTRDPVHRVNVAADRMSLFPDDMPEHFDRWLRDRRLPDSDPAMAMPDGRLFPQRALYGRYVHETLDAEISAAAPDAGFVHLRTRAAAAGPAGAGFCVTLEDGSRVEAGILVLAVSHTAPDLPEFLRAVRHAPGLIPDPWQPGVLDGVSRGDDVLVVGTGLTACDVLAGLRARGHAGRIVAVSRRGLLPRPRTSLPVEPFGDFASRPAGTALELLQRVRGAIREAARLGRPWEDVIAALRNQAGVVWGSLELAQRRRLLRHLRPWWDVHRFQSAPQIDAALQALRESGRLEVVAATPLSASLSAHGIEVSLRPRGRPVAEATRRDFAAVINCTGPGHRSVVSRHEVLSALHEVGALAADAMSLGIEVDRESRAIRPADGAAWDRLFVAGPLARGTHGELMGLPQVSTQPRAVAGQIADLLRRRDDGREQNGWCGRPPVG